eukprot:8172839-Alexandrium_andersonii.AAC.1
MAPPLELLELAPAAGSSARPPPVTRAANGSRGAERDVKCCRSTWFCVSSVVKTSRCGSPVGARGPAPPPPAMASTPATGVAGAARGG